MRLPDWVNHSSSLTQSFAANARSADPGAPAEEKKAAGRQGSASTRVGIEKGLFQEIYKHVGGESELADLKSSNDKEHGPARLESMKPFSQTWDLNLLKAQNSRSDRSGASEVKAASETSTAQNTASAVNNGDAIMTRFKKSSSFSYDHSVRVGELAAKLADRVSSGVKRISAISSDISRYYNELGKYHDIGKYAIPFEILEKPGSLTSEEQQVVRAHPVVGESMLKDKKEFKSILPAVRHHHERWDGTGYPDGLKGNDIPLEARIISVVDSFDAIVSDRPYRKGVEPAKALDELKRCAGTQFDPQIVKAFSQLVSDEFLAATA